MTGEIIPNRDKDTLMGELNDAQLKNRIELVEGALLGLELEAVATGESPDNIARQLSDAELDRKIRLAEERLATLELNEVESGGQSPDNLADEARKADDFWRDTE